MTAVTDLAVDLALTLLSALAPILAGLLVGVLVRYLRSWGLLLDAEHEAKLQARMTQILLAIEEAGRRQTQVAAVASRQLGSGGAASETADPVRTAGEKRMRTLELAAADPVFDALSHDEILQRADAALTTLRAGRVL
jgi:hypothetical protein